MAIRWADPRGCSRCSHEYVSQLHGVPQAAGEARTQRSSRSEPAALRRLRHRCRHGVHHGRRPATRSHRGSLPQLEQPWRPPRARHACGRRPALARPPVHTPARTRDRGSRAPRQARSSRPADGGAPEEASSRQQEARRTHRASHSTLASGRPPSPRRLGSPVRRPRASINSSRCPPGEGGRPETTGTPRPRVG
jgi:hypothetical protein